MRLSEFLAHDHRSCDAHFADLEGAVQQGDWARADAALDAFVAATLQHFHGEEAVLFPALEAAMQQRHGPTEVMRLEHADMRQLLAELRQAVHHRDPAAVAGAGDTLLILLQQHNSKEEQVLYPMADRLLGNATEQLLERIKAAA